MTYLQLLQAESSSAHCYQQLISSLVKKRHMLPLEMCSLIYLEEQTYKILFKDRNSYSFHAYWMVL